VEDGGVTTTGAKGGKLDLMTWARQRPRGGRERWVLEELDAMQADTSSPAAAEAERRAALDRLVLRGVLSESTAEAAAAAPVGAAATVLPRAAPRTRPVPPVRKHDPGAVVGPILVCLAPFALLLPAVTGLELVYAMWVTSLALLAGELVIFLTGARAGTHSALREGARGRLTSRAMLVVAFIALITPLATLAAAIAAAPVVPVGAGWFIGVQGMMVFHLFACRVIIRAQERPQ
jgi:hypothetical protein